METGVKLPVTYCSLLAVGVQVTLARVLDCFSCSSLEVCRKAPMEQGKNVSGSNKKKEK